MIRISSGSLKGRVFHSKSYDSTRPTLSILRQSLFNILAQRIDHCHFLDLFAGTGSVGFEAFSRGAHEVVFIEKHPLLCRLLTENAHKWGVRSTVMQGHYKKGLFALSRQDKAFEVIFMDPPYFYPQTTQICQSIKQKNLLKPNGILVVEQHIKTTTFSSADDAAAANKSLPSLFEQVDHRQYGTSVLDFYTH